MLFSAGTDVLAAPRDIALIAQKLKQAGSLVGQHYIPDYSHMDYIWDLGAKNKVYKPLLAALKVMAGNPADTAAAAVRGGSSG